MKEEKLRRAKKEEPKEKSQKRRAKKEERKKKRKKEEQQEKRKKKKMSKEKIWLSPPHLGQKEKEYVNQAFDTNWIAPLGPNVNGFEKDLEQYTGAKHAAALSSGTAAIHLALRLLDTQPGDYVLCQSFTFCGTVNPVTYLGATPVLIDSEPDTWNMSPDHLAEAIKTIRADKTRFPGRIRAVMPVHLYGMPAKLEELQAVCDEHSIPLVEDAAESLGATYRGRQTGTLGRMGIYSFNGNKIITTSGGGALVADDPELIERARFLATQARDPAPHYQHSVIGFNYRLSNVLAGIGRGQMQVLPQRIEQRRANFERYLAFFADWNRQGFDIRFQEEPAHCRSNRWLTCILVDPARNAGLTREDLRLALEAAHIDARPLWKPMHLQPVFFEAPTFGGHVCVQLFDQGLCLPSGSNLADQDFERIFSTLHQVFRQVQGALA